MEERNYLVTVGLIAGPKLPRVGMKPGKDQRPRIIAKAVCGVTFEGTECLNEFADVVTLVQHVWRFPDDFIGGAAFTDDKGKEYSIEQEDLRVRVLAVELAPDTEAALYNNRGVVGR